MTIPEPLPRKWVRVEFHGLVPEGEMLTDVDTVEVSKNLMKVFGFEYIDGLTVTQK